MAKRALTRRGGRQDQTRVSNQNREIKTLKSGKSRALAKVREYKSSGFALGNSALFLGGAATAGVVRAYQPQIGNMPIDVSLGLVMVTAGVFTKMPWLIYAGSGAFSAFVGGYAQEQAEMYLYGSGSVAVPASAAGQ
jgi:hypothetical protein